LRPPPAGLSSSRRSRMLQCCSCLRHVKRFDDRTLGSASCFRTILQNACVLVVRRCCGAFGRERRRWGKTRTSRPRPTPATASAPLRKRQSTGAPQERERRSTLEFRVSADLGLLRC
jgi:hypothetical protein